MKPKLLVVVYIFLSFNTLDGFSAPVQPSFCTLLKINRYFNGTNRLLGSSRHILIVGNKIVKITNGNVPKVSGCKVVDLRHLILTPGLIDSHSHLFLTDLNFGKDFSKELIEVNKRSPIERKRMALLYARDLIFSGFTSVRDLGNSGRFWDLRLRSTISSMKVLGPRLFVSGPGIAIKEGEFPIGTRSKDVEKEYRIVRQLSEVPRLIDSYKNRNVDVIKVYADNDPNPNEMSQELLSALTSEAHKRGLRVAAHASFKSSTQKAALAGVDSIEHAEEITESTLGLMAKRNIALVATDVNRADCMHISNHNPDPIFQSCEQYRNIRSHRLLSANRLGVPIVFGSDAYVELGQNRGNSTLNSLVAYVEEGLTTFQAFKAATYSAALLLGHPELGMIKINYIADIVGYYKNPFNNIYDINTVAFVMKNGQIVFDNSKKLVNESF